MDNFRKRYPARILVRLENAYNEKPNARGAQIKEIALNIGLPIKEVRRWFYVNRYRLKKTGDGSDKQILGKEEIISMDITPKKRTDIFTKSNEKPQKRRKRKYSKSTEKMYPVKTIKKEKVLESKEKQFEKEEKMNTETKEEKKVPDKKMEQEVKKITIPAGIQWFLMLQVPSNPI